MRAGSAAARGLCAIAEARRGASEGTVRMSFVSIAALYGFIGLLLASAWTDFKSFIIPNAFSAAILLLYPVYVLTAPAPVEWLGGLVVGASALAVGFGCFALRVFGGGDAKLLAVTSLWAGPALVFDFLALTALAGGVLVLVLYVRHRIAAAPTLAMVLVTKPDSSFAKQPMPYGVAIALGGLYVAFTLLGIA